jgi:hypothetical protein
MPNIDSFELSDMWCNKISVRMMFLFVLFQFPSSTFDWLSTLVTRNLPIVLGFTLSRMSQGPIYGILYEVR